MDPLRPLVAMPLILFPGIYFQSLTPPQRIIWIFKSVREQPIFRKPPDSCSNYFR